MLDADQTGKISFKNIKQQVRFLELNMSDEQMQEMIDAGDIDGDGEINIEEYL